MPYLSSIGSIVGDIHGVTKSKIVWEITNFLFLTAEKGDYYTSPSFSLSYNFFHLRVYPEGNRPASPGHISVFIENENNHSCCLDYSLCLMERDGTMVNVYSDFSVSVNSDWGYNNFFNKSLIEEDNLNIVCVLKLRPKKRRKRRLSDKSSNSGRCMKLRALGELSENFKSIYANKDSCDVSLKVKNMEFKAHKFILMARSPVFAAMFQYDTLEKQTGIIDIPDCDPETFPLFLEYLYCGCLEDISLDNAFDLYCTSNKYDVQTLKEFCVAYLVRNLAADNLCNVVVLADKYDEKKLLIQIQKFFNENFSKIFLTPEWVNLLKNDPDLANKLLIEMSKIKGSH